MINIPNRAEKCTRRKPGEVHAPQGSCLIKKQTVSLHDIGVVFLHMSKPGL